MKILLVAVFALSIAGCAGDTIETSQDIHFDYNDIQYIEDERSGLCFAYVSTEERDDGAPEGVGLAAVDCEQVPEQLTRPVTR